MFSSYLQSSFFHPSLHRLHLTAGPLRLSSHLRVPAGYAGGKDGVCQEQHVAGVAGAGQEHLRQVSLPQGEQHQWQQRGAAGETPASEQHYLPPLPGVELRGTGPGLLPGAVRRPRQQQGAPGDGSSEQSANTSSCGGLGLCT